MDKRIKLQENIYCKTTVVNLDNLMGQVLQKTKDSCQKAPSPDCVTEGFSQIFKKQVILMLCRFLQSIQKKPLSITLYAVETRPLSTGAKQKLETEFQVKCKEMGHCLAGQREPQRASALKDCVPTAGEGSEGSYEQRMISLQTFGWYRGNWSQHHQTGSKWSGVLCACGQHAINFFHLVEGFSICKTAQGHDSEYY